MMNNISNGSTAATSSPRKVNRRGGLLALTLVALTCFDFSLQANPADAVRARQAAARVRQSATQASQLVSAEVRRRGRLLQNNADARQTRGSTLWNELQTKDPMARRYNEAAQLLQDAAQKLQQAKGKLQGLTGRVNRGKQHIQNGDNRVTRGDLRFRTGQIGTAIGHYRIAKDNYTDAIQEFAAAGDDLNEIANLLNAANSKLNAAETIIDQLPEGGGMNPEPPMPAPIPGVSPMPTPAPGSGPIPGMMP